MSVGPVGESAFRAWDADGWDDLRAIWEDLIPDPDVPPMFRHISSLILNPQQSGWVFERWVMEAFRLSGAEVEHRHRNLRTGSFNLLEEIDGLVYDGWQGFLVETKYEKDPVSIDPIFRLHLMAEQRPAGTLGLFFSMSGFTGPALELSDRLRPIRVLLIEEKDVRMNLQNQPLPDMISMVRNKWKRAVQSGRTDPRIR